MKINLMKLLERDDLQHNQDHVEKAKDELWLRVGNTGVHPKNSPCVGSCPRKALLRKLGLDLEHSKDRDVMFELGRAMELVIIEKLKRQLPESYSITGDEVNAVGAELDDTKITGRPDIFVRDAAGELILGIELKTICSVYTAKSVVFDGEPKFSHLAQAANYMILADLDSYKLVYVQPVDFEAPFWMRGKYGMQPPKEYREETCPKKDLIEYRPEGAKGQQIQKPFKLLPNRLVYDLEFRDDTLFYREEDSGGPWVKTIIDVESITRFFYTVNEQDSKQKLADRPEVRKPTGEKGTFSFCDPKYCELSEICDKHERNFSKWVAEVKAIAKS